MIPAEAVEAAAKAAHASRWPNAPWDALNEDARAYARKNARLALEAAAPHMHGEWDKQRKYAALDAISELGSDEPGEQFADRNRCVIPKHL